ncbi:carbonate dehydratase [Simkania negevensis]|uniref:Carbonic anhydrase 2 n=1 Tax=Simkania negevensis (strain ATCC VR-1471 / DSM 27360 / Z) TaxID=331113 RepID=F8L9G5_SIMNZ|nr:carbonate dehydratase [Simkania negevensis]CCB89501.1 carbonic anhydrase 2 [Simkania negevensis Z]
MRELDELFENNRRWAKNQQIVNPSFFQEMSKCQTPKYLWIGCSDSRIPANEILGLEPGEVFVHRNVANIFPHTDFNCLSVLQYGIEYLNIEHVIVCGHTQCGGVAAAMEQAQLGLVDNWLRNIRDIYSREKETLESIENPKERYNRLVEFNVLYQVMNICHTTIVQNAWGKQKKVSVHGWVYDISTGLLKDLNCCVSSLGQVEDTYRTLKLH